jgi:hypothetical protein
MKFATSRTSWSRLSCRWGWEGPDGVLVVVVMMMMLMMTTTIMTAPL